LRFAFLLSSARICSSSIVLFSNLFKERSSKACEEGEEEDEDEKREMVDEKEEKEEEDEKREVEEVREEEENIEMKKRCSSSSQRCYTNKEYKTDKGKE
jgi:hypothetical protein